MKSPVALVFLLLLASKPSIGATTGILSGVVTDDQFAGAPSANALVTATSPSQTVTVTTDSHGRYVFLSLSPGSYTVTVEVTAFGRFQSRETVYAVVMADERTVANVRFPFRIIDERGGNPVERIRRPGIVADLYQYGSLWPAPQSDRNASLLRFTPGITFGAGAQMAH